MVYRALLQAECKAMACPYPMRAVKGLTQPLVPVSPSCCPLLLHYLIIGDGAEEFAAIGRLGACELDFMHEAFADIFER